MLTGQLVVGGDSCYWCLYSVLYVDRPVSGEIRDAGVDTGAGRTDNGASRRQRQHQETSKDHGVARQTSQYGDQRHQTVLDGTEERTRTHRRIVHGLRRGSCPGSVILTMLEERTRTQRPVVYGLRGGSCQRFLNWTMSEFLELDHVSVPWIGPFQMSLNLDGVRVPWIGPC
jgi:hypothetical protein